MPPLLIAVVLVCIVATAGLTWVLFRAERDR